MWQGTSFQLCRIPRSLLSHLAGKAVLGAMVLQAIPAKRTPVNQPAPHMHFARELVEYFTFLNLGVWTLIDLFFASAGVRDTVSDCPFGWSRHPPTPNPQHHYCLPADPLASYLPTSPSFPHLVPTVVLVCRYHAMMGQCGANPICWTHPNYSLVVTGREPNDSGYCGMLFCAIINFL